MDIRNEWESEKEKKDENGAKTSLILFLNFNVKEKKAEKVI
jgi:hypothetical protein